MLIIVVGMPDLDNWATPRLLSTAARMVEYAWNEKLASLGLTHAGAIALEVLETGGPEVQAQLAVKARVKPQTMSRTLARLEAHGCITRVNEARAASGHFRAWQKGPCPGVRA
jgi:MarR family transcriptional regulator, organic hydroperoxide resistance regulator